MGYFILSIFFSTLLQNQPLRVQVQDEISMSSQEVESAGALEMIGELNQPKYSTPLPKEKEKKSSLPPPDFDQPED